MLPRRRKGSPGPLQTPPHGRLGETQVLPDLDAAELVAVAVGVGRRYLEECRDLRRRQVALQSRSLCRGRGGGGCSVERAQLGDHVVQHGGNRRVRLYSVGLGRSAFERGQELGKSTHVSSGISSAFSSAVSPVVSSGVSPWGADHCLSLLIVLWRLKLALARWPPLHLG